MENNQSPAAPAVRQSSGIAKKVLQFFSSGVRQKALRATVISFGGLIVLLLAFTAGEFVGYRKASFSYSWGANYHRNFAGPHGGFLAEFTHGFSDREYTNAHGTFGSIIAIDLSTTTSAAGMAPKPTGQVRLAVIGGDNVEKTILVSGVTVITNRRERIAASGLNTGDRLVIIGSPNEQGQIEAKFIRVFR